MLGCWKSKWAGVRRRDVGGWSGEFEAHFGVDGDETETFVDGAGGVECVERNALAVVGACEVDEKAEDFGGGALAARGGDGVDVEDVAAGAGEVISGRGVMMIDETAGTNDLPCLDGEETDVLV